MVNNNTYVTVCIFFNKFILLQLTDSYFYSVTSYDLLASFSALVTLSSVALIIAQVIIQLKANTLFHINMIIGTSSLKSLANWLGLSAKVYMVCNPTYIHAYIVSHSHCKLAFYFPLGGRNDLSLSFVAYTKKKGGLAMQD